MSAIELVRTPALQHDVERYMAHKKKRLTGKSERGYLSYLREFVRSHPTLTLEQLNPPGGAVLIEDHLNSRYGHLAPRTYNKAYTVLHDFVKWHLAREGLARDPMLLIEKATPRTVHRTRFSEEEWLRIFASNPDPYDQVALHLLLDYALRKGALQNVRFEHFDRESHELTIFTKGQKVFRIDIPDGRIWRLLDDLNAPGSHYLLCRRVTRRRALTHRKQLVAAAWLVEEASRMIAAVGDPQCAREIEMAAPAIEHLERWIGLAGDASRVQLRLTPEEPIGEHAAHLWWYRCLQRAGVVEKGITAGRKMHSARYTAAQRLLDESCDITVVQTLLCHASSATTDLYVKGDSKKVGERMAGYVGRGEPDLPSTLLDRVSRPQQ